MYACSGNYEQRYENFSDFSKENLRNKGWFPNIVFSGAYELKNNSYLDPLCAFGEFSYSKSDFYDSIFTNPNRQISISLFEEKAREHKKRRPNWFLNLDNMSKSQFETIKMERFYIVRQKDEKKIYFVLSN